NAPVSSLRKAILIKESLPFVEQRIFIFSVNRLEKITNFYSLQALVVSSPNTLAIVFEIPCAPKHILYSDSSDIPKLRTILTIITNDATANNIFFTLISPLDKKLFPSKAYQRFTKP
ncbi:hypothetical protein, partial [Peribacillus simplex]|uniref:hypothetical protein n=1 Tax=Peribacillus simplex TaxID=1478 RepID=UPI003D26DFC6